MRRNMAEGARDHTVGRKPSVEKEHFAEFRARRRVGVIFRPWDGGKAERDSKLSFVGSWRHGRGRPYIPAAREETSQLSAHADILARWRRKRTRCVRPLLRRDKLP